jgi:hypothetical protein
LTDAPAPSTVAAPVAQDIAPLTLVGTVGNSLALLRRPDGSIELKAVGESIDGAQVLAVRVGEVELGRSGQKSILKKPKEPQE